MARVALCSLLLVRATASFSPFADVEELKPHRLHPYCEDARDEDGHRWCSRSIKKRLEDGGDIELTWKMHIDPDKILSLDTEAEHGVKIVRCDPAELEMFVPHTHLGHLEVGKFITASPFMHNCQHQAHSAMYHKVVQVKAKKTADAGLGKLFHLHIATKAVPHMGHTAKFIQYNFSYMPIEARETQNPWPAKRTYLDRPAAARRLQFKFPSFAPSTGNIQAAGQSSGNMDRKNGIVSFNPDQVSNFGWNWDFFLNNSKTPRFVIDRPDTRGVFLLENPYIKAHAGCFLNFTSRFEGFMKAPHIKWAAGLNGHGILQGRLKGALNSTRSLHMDPSTYKIPSEVLENFPFLRLLTKFDKTRWFNQVQHGVGPMSTSFTPGFQFQMEIYHRGPFSGSLATGGSTRGTMRPVLHFDSEKGFEQTLQGELLNTTVYPPLYLIFTKVFEFGLRAEPIFHLKGDFMGFQGVEAALHFRAYQNCTISREGEGHFSVDAEKSLVVYPFRVVGPKKVDFNTKYTLKITAKGVEKLTRPTSSWGQVEFHEKVSSFNFGNFTDAEVANVPITVVLEQVDSNGVVTKLGSGSYTAMTWEQGISHPVPTWIGIMDSNNQQVANAQVYIVHKVNVVPFLSSRIKGIGFSFPTVSLMSDQISTEFPSLDPKCQPMLHLVLGHRSYLVDLSAKQLENAVTATGQTVVELYPSFVDMWAQCLPGMKNCTSPTMELWCGSTKLGSAMVPPFSIPVPQDSNLLEDLLSIHTTSAPAVGTEDTKTLPEVQLLTKDQKPIASVGSQVRLSPPTASSEFLSPSFAIDVALGTAVTFIWTVADCTAGQEVVFDVIPMRLEDEQPNQEPLSQYRRIGDQWLVKDSGSTQAGVPGTCQQQSVHGVPAEKLPCSFAKQLAFNRPVFKPGDHLLVMVTWKVQGITHKIYSPAFQLTGARRLQGAAPPAALPPSGVQTATHAPPAMPSADANVSGKMQSEECQRQDLHFHLGQGVEVRMEVLSMGVPQALQQDMPMMSDEADEGPIFATPWEAMGGNQPAMEAKDFLPETVCEMGMCDTMLPGCREAKFKSLFFPRLVFNFSREMGYPNSTNSTTQKMMQEAMAWAFSAMPEAIQVVLQELEHREQEMKQQTAVPNYGFGNYGQQQQQQQQNQFGFNNGFNNGAQNNWFNTPQATGTTQQMPQAFGKWWNTQRRLSTVSMGVDAAGRPVEMPQRLLPHQARVEFLDGLPYKLDHVILRKMIKQGMIDIDDGKSKELGKLRITGFYLEDGEQVPKVPMDSVVVSQPGWLIGFAAVAAVMAVALGFGLRRRESGYEAQLLAQKCEEGLE